MMLQRRSSELAPSEETEEHISLTAKERKEALDGCAIMLQEIQTQCAAHPDLALSQELRELRDTLLIQLETQSREWLDKEVQQFHERVNNLFITFAQEYGEYKRQSHERLTAETRSAFDALYKRAKEFYNANPTDEVNALLDHIDLVGAQFKSSALKKNFDLDFYRQLLQEYTEALITLEEKYEKGGR